MGNSLILLAFASEKKLRTYSNYYIINITLADLFVGLLCMPIRSMIFLFDGRWVFGQTFCHISITFHNALPGISTFGVVVISIDRYLATSYPLLHHRNKSKRVAGVVNIMTWVIPLMLWLGVSTIWDLVSPNERQSQAGFCQPNYVENLSASIIIVLLAGYLPGLTILIISIKIYHKEQVFCFRPSTEVYRTTVRRIPVALVDYQSAFLPKEETRSVECSGLRVV
ncbi:histamine H1 receptor-like [Diadema antillarum]|uniref:histamine H1 receptor-like n=1 Tax=Diadema antillarum TaxID=105358 RepID=UPI003A885268